MFCPNCGKEIQENAAFCSNCGNALSTQHPIPVSQQSAGSIQPTQQAPTANTTSFAEPPQHSFQTPTPTVKVKKSNKKVVTTFIAIAIAIVFFMLGKFVIAPSMMSDNDEELDYNYDFEYDYDTGYNDTDTDTDTYYENEDSYSPNGSSANSAYEEIFLNHNIVDSPTFFFELDAAEFAVVYNDGSVEKIAYGYENDIIKEQISTLYLTDYSYSQNIERYNQLKALSFCTVTETQSNNYHIITVKFTGLDSKANIQKLQEYNILPNTSDAEYISYSISENNLISNGYVKK